MVIDFLSVLWVHLHGSRELKTNGFALVDPAYMDGASSHEEIFKKEKWYECYANMKDYKDPWYLRLFENLKVFRT